MERVSSDKRYKLINRRFAIEAHDGQVAVEHSIGSAEELRQVLDESSNVTPPTPVEEIFTRIAGWLLTRLARVARSRESA
jgi:N-hydroxyarylamine O-acetyltransferase